MVVTTIRGLGFSTDQTTRRYDSEEWLAVKDSYALYLSTIAGASEATQFTYYHANRILAEFIEREGEPLTTASRKAVGQYVAWFRTNRSAATAFNKLMAARNFYQWAIYEGLREDDPTEGMKVRRTKVQGREPYTDEELRAMIGACYEQRDRAMLFTLLATGLRAAEMLALTTDDIDWKKGAIFVRHGKGNKQRRIGISLAVLSEIKSYLAGRTGLIWLTEQGEPMTVHRLYLQVRRLAKDADVVNAGCHRFRNTFATRFLRDGGDLGALQTILGHNQVAQTIHYAAASQAERANEIQRKQRFAGLIAGEDDEGESQEHEPELVASAGRAKYQLRPSLMVTLRLMARGLRVGQMATVLGVAHGSASSRIQSVLEHLEVGNPGEAIIRATQAGLLTEKDIQPVRPRSNGKTAEPQGKGWKEARGGLRVLTDGGES